LGILVPGNVLAVGAGAVHGLSHLSPHVLAALLPLLVLVLALDVYCLVDLVRAKSVKGGVPKLVWAVVILFVSAPIGALVYLFFGRDRGRDAGPGGTAPPGQVAQPGPPERTPERRAGPSAELRGPVVTTTGLTRDYGGTGLFGVDLLVPRGCVYGLVGLNGSGKTTLLSLLSGTRRPDHGTVSLGIGRQQIAVCPDVCEFDGWLTASEVVDLARSLVAPAAGGEAVAAALRMAGLADSATRRVGGFSRGMTQRLGLACALVGDPELLILDEPTSALDPAGRAEILGLVAAMRGHRTVIFSSHILADVQRIADQVGILRDGRLIYQGATQDLVDTYLTPSWIVRIAGDAAPVTAALAGQSWVTRVESAGTGTIRVDATSIDAGERGIPAAIAACGARQVSCEPAAADLESAFLALTGASAVGAVGAAGAAGAAGAVGSPGPGAGARTTTGGAG
jgi:ABC-2 type transport system ATP-binding protein